MSLSMTSILVHSEQVPAEARDAIRAAHEAAPEQRGAQLVSAARILHLATGLDCSDARELVGLPSDGDCA
jgi:hypothetical protein